MCGINTSECAEKRRVTLCQRVTLRFIIDCGGVVFVVGQLWVGSEAVCVGEIELHFRCLFNFM